VAGIPSRRVFVGGLLDDLSGRGDVLSRPGRGVACTQERRCGHEREQGQTDNEFLIHTDVLIFVSIPDFLRAPRDLGAGWNGGDAAVRLQPNANTMFASHRLWICRISDTLIWLSTYRNDLPCSIKVIHEACMLGALRAGVRFWMPRSPAPARTGTSRV